MVSIAPRIIDATIVELYFSFLNKRFTTPVIIKLRNAPVANALKNGYRREIPVDVVIIAIPKRSGL
jgi:hypothetical protein